jgi:hypothetical protein
MFLCTVHCGQVCTRTRQKTKTDQGIIYSSRKILARAKKAASTHERGGPQHRRAFWVPNPISSHKTKPGARGGGGGSATFSNSAPNAPLASAGRPGPRGGRAAEIKVHQITRTGKPCCPHLHARADIAFSDCRRYAETARENGCRL